MCLIVTIVMFVLAVQNLMQGYVMMGALTTALGFCISLFTLEKLQAARCDRNGNCNSCMLPDWVTNIFKKKEEK